MSKANRRLFTEKLESRALMAGDLTHNFLEPNDVNDDRRVSPSDALQVINGLNDLRDASTNTEDTNLTFRDVNDDSRLSPVDALLVINELNVRNDDLATTQASVTKTEARVASSGQATARLEYEVMTAQKELSIKVRDAVPNTTYAVQLNDLALGELFTDSKGRGRIVLSQGDDNSSHLPLPTSLPQLTAETELVIGDIIRGRLTNITVSSKAAPAPDDSGNGGGGGSNAGLVGNWVANFAPVGQLQRKAEFESEVEDGRTKSKFKIEIEGAQPNQSFSVLIGNLSLGEVTVNSRGKAKVTWSSSPKAGELLLPAGFPSISDALTLKIGQATANFRRI